MVMTAGSSSSAVFIDTNILIYANLLGSPFRSVAQAKLQAYEQAGIELWLSRQVLREYLAALTRPQVYTNPIPVSALIADVVRFEAEFLIAEDSPQVTQLLLALLSSLPMGGKQIHDANIVATMQVMVSHGS